MSDSDAVTDSGVSAEIGSGRLDILCACRFPFSREGFGFRKIKILCLECLAFLTFCWRRKARGCTRASAAAFA